jgi:GT2 family glycosyltransferase
MTVEIIREKARIGYGKANNAGFRLCRERGFDYLIIANQDGWVSEHLIRELIAPFQNDENILLTAPILRTYEGDAIEDFFIKYYLTQVPAMVSDLMNGKSKAYYEMERISGACFAFNLKSRLYSYPYFFDPLFHMYFEDEDLCRRVRYVNGKIVLVNANAAFYHQHSHTTDSENKSGIEKEKSVSEKILRLKDGSKRPIKTFYGIFVSTISNFTYYLLRGELSKAYNQLRSFVIIIFRLPAILKSRRQDLASVKKY